MCCWWVKVRLPRQALGQRFCHGTLLVAWLQLKDLIFVSVENSAFSGAPHPQWLPWLQQKALHFGARGIGSQGYRMLVLVALIRGSNGQKPKKTREHVTQSLKPLWFCKVNIIFNVVTIFSWALHTLRSSHMSPLTTNCCFSSDATCYINTVQTKSIVRECNVVSFTIKKRINRNTKTTL